MRLNAIDWLAFEPSDRQAEVDFLILVKKYLKQKEQLSFSPLKQETLHWHNWIQHSVEDWMPLLLDTLSRPPPSLPLYLQAEW